MEEQFASLGLPVERLSATTPDTISDEDFAPFSADQVFHGISPTEAAISISHFRAWRHMLDSGRKQVLVLEDDVKLSPLLPAFLAEIEIGELGLLRLETRLTRVMLHGRADPAPAGVALHMPLSFEAGTGAYIISADYAAKILASPKRFARPLDGLLFSPKSPLRDASRMRVAVPGLALNLYETSPEFDVPSSILVSDAWESREARFAQEAVRPGPRVSDKIRREFSRLRRQLATAREWIWLRSARKTIVPFAGEDVTAPRSVARQPV